MLVVRRMGQNRYDDLPNDDLFAMRRGCAICSSDARCRAEGGSALTFFLQDEGTPSGANILE